MIRLVLLLLGTPTIRRAYPFLLAAGILLALAGVALFIDGFDGVVYFPLHLFGYLMLVQGAVMLATAVGAAGMRRRLLLARSLAVIALALLIIDPDRASQAILAVVFGIALAIDGVLRVASALMVRFRGWRGSTVVGAAQILFAAFLLEPWPTHYAGTVPYCIGVGLLLTGATLVRLALRLRRLGGDESLAALFSRGWPGFPILAADDAQVAPADPLIVHVWTATGTAERPRPRPIVDRYIAAVDDRGVISTGHAAMELAPDLYISHYPAEEIDQSPEEFGRILNAGIENDVAGRFLPSYAAESQEWCPSTMRVAFHRFDERRLRAYWSTYRTDTTYNLTNRNCSSSVALALETALEGVLAEHRRDWHYLLRLAFSPELWVAARMRKHAETMAWTPGLVLDYARALRGALDPPPLSWPALAGSALRTVRQAKARQRAQVASTAQAVRAAQTTTAAPSTTAARTASETRTGGENRS